MQRRIIAWILIVGFVLLIVNLSFFQWQSTYSTSVYMAIIIFYIIFSPNKRTNMQDEKDKNDSPEKDNF